MFFPHRMEFDILNEIRILRIAFLVIRKIETESITGQKLHPNIFTINNLNEISDKLLAYWFKFLTTCVNVNLNTSEFHPVLVDEPNKYPSLFDKDKGEESFEEEEEVVKNEIIAGKIQNQKKKKNNIWGNFLSRKSVQQTLKIKVLKNESSQDIMMYTFKSKGNILKSYLSDQTKKEKNFQMPEYTELAKCLEKIAPNLNCINIFYSIY